MGPEEENKQKNLIICPSENEITAEDQEGFSVLLFYYYFFNIRIKNIVMIGRTLNRKTFLLLL